MITRRNFISGAGVLTTYSALGHDAEAAHRVLLLSSTTIISPISLGPYLPASPVPTLAAGMKRLVSGYSGAGINVIRESDSAALDIPFNTRNDQLNLSVLNAFTGGAECYINIVYDQSGNGNHLTTTAGNANKPVISTKSSNLIGVYKTATLNFDNTLRNLLIPSMSLSWNGITAFISCRPQWNQQNFTYWTFPTPQFSLNTFASTYGLWVAQEAARVAKFSRCQPTVLGYVSNAGGANGSVYVDGSGFTIGGISVDAFTSAGTIFSASGNPYNGDFLGFVVYNSALNATNAGFVNAALQPNVTRGNTQVVFDGDSITVCIGATYGQSLENQLQGNLITNPDMINLGNSGNTAANMASAYSTNQSLTFNAGYSKNIYHFWGGTNDLHISGTTGANLWNNTVSPMMSAVVATGFTPVIGTILPEFGESGGTTTQRLAYNALVLASGYTVADYASQTTMGNIANTSNATYYVQSGPGSGGLQGVHPTTAGYALLEPIAAAALNSVL